jgi:hypothetical protein
MDKYYIGIMADLEYAVKMSAANPHIALHHLFTTEAVTGIPMVLPGETGRHACHASLNKQTTHSGSD